MVSHGEASSGRHGALAPPLVPATADAPHLGPNEGDWLFDQSPLYDEPYFLAATSQWLSRPLGTVADPKPRSPWRPLPMLPLRAGQQRLAAHAMDDRAPAPRSTQLEIVLSRPPQGLGIASMLGRTAKTQP